MPRRAAPSSSARCSTSSTPCTIRPAADPGRQEFESVWSQVEGRSRSAEPTFADEGTTEEKAREDYQRIAERRVRLGSGARRDRRTQRYQGRGRGRDPAVVDGHAQFPGRSSRSGTTTARIRRRWPLRAPIFEDKVVDFLSNLRPSPTSRCQGDLFKPDDAADAA